MAHTQLLRPWQVDELQDEKRSLEAMMTNQHVQDKGSVNKQLRQLKHQLETQSPKPPTAAEVDGLAKREAQLQSEMVQGMPSQEEMRKNPPGAVGKHMTWEKRNKQKLLEWKNIRLRMNIGDNDPDLANFERHRPTTSSLNMDNAQIHGTTYFMPTPTPAYTEGHERIWPDNYPTGAPESNPIKKEKRGMSPEMREAASKRMKAMHAKKKADAQAKTNTESTEPPVEPTVEHVD
jgi:hypothetical protein